MFALSLSSTFPHLWSQILPFLDIVFEVKIKGNTIQTYWNNQFFIYPCKITSNPPHTHFLIGSKQISQVTYFDLKKWVVTERSGVYIYANHTTETAKVTHKGREVFTKNV